MPIESEHDVYVFFRHSIETDRQSVESAKQAKLRGPVDWPKPDFKTLPRTVVMLYLLETGCSSSFFRSPRDKPMRWNRLLFKFFQREPFGPGDGDGACEVIFAQRLAQRLGARSRLEETVLIDRLHKFLTREELLAYDLESTQYVRGIIGLEATSKQLLQKPAAELTLAERVELQLALPPYGMWEDINACRNPIRLKEVRDGVLYRVARSNLDTKDAVQIALAQPLACTLVRR